LVRTAFGAVSVRLLPELANVVAENKLGVEALVEMSANQGRLWNTAYLGAKYLVEPTLFTGVYHSLDPSEEKEFTTTWKNVFALYAAGGVSGAIFNQFVGVGGIGAAVADTVVYSAVEHGNFVEGVVIEGASHAEHGILDGKSPKIKPELKPKLKK